MRKIFHLFALLGFVLADGVVADENGDIEKRRAFFEAEGRATRFQTAEDAFPHRVVHAGDDVWTLLASEASRTFAPTYQWEGQTYDLDAFNERTATSALLILKDGKIVKEIYLAGSTHETRFISFSMAKSVTSTLVGIALEDGLIDSLDDPLTKYLRSLTGSAYAGVSIEDALTMTSGVGWSEEGYDWTDESVPLVRGWNDAIVAHRYRFVEMANTLSRAHPIGAKFNYSTLETSILGWLVETVTKRRLSTYMEERLWQLAGMEFDASWVLDGPPELGREMAGGMLNASLRDYGRFALMIANRGRANGKQLVSSKWVEAASAPSRPAIKHGKLYEGYPLGYGYQWWLLDDGRFEAQGIYGQFFYIAPDAGVVIVKLSHWPEAWVDAMELESYAFFEAVIAELE